MVKIPEAEARMFKDVFVCRDCKTAIRASTLKVLGGSVKCRKCGSRALRPKKKK